MTEQDIVTQVFSFFYNNILSILLVVSLLSILTIYIILNNIEFKKPKTKVEQVVVVEKFNALKKPPTFKEMQQDLKNQTDNKTCVGLKDKSGCASLGGCVWVTSDNGKVKKCQQGNKTGPTDMCYCKPNSKTAKTGKLIPWDEFYYLDDSGSISKGSPKPCMNKDGECTPS